MRQTVNEAHGRWPGILQALGTDAKFLRNIHGPCPRCGGKDRFRFDDQGIGRFFCSICGSGDGFKLLQVIHGWDFKKAADEVDRVLGTVTINADQPSAIRSEDDKRKAIRKLLEASRRVERGDPVWRYLERRCGSPEGILDDLRYHPGIRHSREDSTLYPAMLAIMRYPDGSGASVHRTYLTADGRKAAVDPVRKIMPGLPLGESAVRLGPSGLTLGIAEGIETAICAGRRFGLPVWAAISAAGMEDWVAPVGVERIVVFGDNDFSYTGQAAAFYLAKQLRHKGLKVDVEIPPTVGSDWADVFSNQTSAA